MHSNRPRKCFRWCTTPLFGTALGLALLAAPIAARAQTVTPPTPTPTQGSCVGDCSNTHQVTVLELITMVNIALGSADVSTCTAGDANGDGTITVNEIIAGVSIALGLVPCGGEPGTPTVGRLRPRRQQHPPAPR